MRCHPAQSSTQAKSAHARSLHKAASHPLASRFDTGEWLSRDPVFRLRFRIKDHQMRAQAYDDRNVMDIPVEWAFGAGGQAVTFVTRIDKDCYLEHFYSYYSVIDRMAPTAGQHVLQPRTLPEAMGLPYKTMDPRTGIVGCFECHSTGPVRVDPQQGLHPAEAGVRCEACHGPGAEHVRSRARQSISNPRRLSAKQNLEFCGRCHRPLAAEKTQIDWNYSWNVRHQPIYLSQSKCFTESSGKLSCLTCHDPHTSLNKNNPAFYRERCLSCHGGESAYRRPAHVCVKEAGSDCAACHMPGVSPQPALRFTNHWIGVFQPERPLRPIIHRQ